MMPHYEKGKYRAQVTAQGFGRIDNEKQTPFFFLEFEPTEALSDGAELPDPVYRRDLQLFITEKSVERTVETLASFGWEGTSFSDLDPANDGHHSFVGLGIEVICSHSQKDDKVYENWNLPMTGGVSRENESGLSKNLDKLFGKKLKARTKSAPKAKDDGLSPMPAGVAPSDDIPF